MNPIVEKVYQIGIIPVIAFNSVNGTDGPAPVQGSG